ncbi:MAG TPA: tonB-system energizer ExbB [Ancylobacter sp.]
MLTLRRTASPRSRLKVLLALAILGSHVVPALAQQPAAEAPVTQAPAIQVPVEQAPAAPTPMVAPTQAPATAAPATTAPAASNPATTAPAEAPATGAAPADTTATPLEDPAQIHAEGGEDTTVAKQLPHDLSPWGMFMAADIVVKSIMVGLAFASVVTWTVWLAKTLELLVSQRRLRQALRGYLASASLDAARTVGAAGPAGAMLRSTDLELRRSGDLPAEGIKERVAISLNRIEVAAGRAITRGTGLLATIGATAPFVGLFGTVWGIMNSFIGISKAQTTNLAVVAPGIAEALLATAIGLVAAIPAVVIYNHFSRQVSGYRVLMGDAAAEMLRLLSRDLDRRDAATAPRASANTTQVTGRARVSAAE